MACQNQAKYIPIKNELVLNVVLMGKQELYTFHHRQYSDHEYAKLRIVQLLNALTVLVPGPRCYFVRTFPWSENAVWGENLR